MVDEREQDVESARANAGGLAAHPQFALDAADLEAVEAVDVLQAIPAGGGSSP